MRMTKAHRAAISQAMMGKQNSLGKKNALGNKGMRGRKFSQLHKHRISRSQKIRWSRINNGK